MMPDPLNSVLSLRGQILSSAHTDAIQLRFHLGKRRTDEVTLSATTALLLYQSLKSHLHKGHAALLGNFDKDVISRRMTELNSHPAEIPEIHIAGLDAIETIVAEIDPIPQSNDLQLQTISRTAEVRNYRLDAFATNAIVAVLELCLVGSLAPASRLLH